MALILSIETSVKICSAALHESGSLLASSEVFIEKSHSGVITLLIDQVLKNAKKTTGDLQAVALASGPGSYTGLRIGTSVAKGLCFALDVPLIAVGTLEAMAYGMNRVNVGKALLCPMLDARRMEVYCAFYESDGTGTEPVRAVVVDEHSFSDKLSRGPVLFFGDGAEKCRPLLEKHPHAFFPQITGISAVHVGALAYQKFMKSQFEDLVNFESFYLKEFRVGRKTIP